ncbi:MAG TPA: hypothetical protein VLD19_02470, partial [Chitinophagaceae bacterium]|nr:hypothetical protein [Chitinophagaceae bacterium]
MIAYNTGWLDNLYIQGETRKGLREGSIGAEEAKVIYERYAVGFYSPNLFIRIAFFALTVVIALFTLGLFVLMGGLDHESSWTVCAILVGGLAYGALETLVRSKHLYRAGA